MIYFLEDDASIRELVLYTLDSSGFDASGFETPSEFFNACEEQRPDLVLMDIMLPEQDGIECLKQFRLDEKNKMIPVMMITAKSGEFDKVKGLESGADDYLTKPFGMAELIARVKALFRRVSYTEKEKEIFTLGPIKVDTLKHEVYEGERPVSLTLKEYELLCLFIKNPGMVFSRDALLNKIWGYSFDGENRTVDVHIRSLRTKLGDASEMVETVRGVGYRMGETKQ